MAELNAVDIVCFYVFRGYRRSSAGLTVDVEPQDESISFARLANLDNRAPRAVRDCVQRGTFAVLRDVDSSKTRRRVESCALIEESSLPR